MSEFDSVISNLTNIGSEEQPLFIAKEACKILNIDFADAMLTRLTYDDWSFYPVNNYAITTSLLSYIAIINKQGLYKLVMASETPDAIRYRQLLDDHNINADQIPTTIDESISYIQELINN